MVIFRMANRQTGETESRYKRVIIRFRIPNPKATDLDMVHLEQSAKKRRRCVR